MSVIACGVFLFQVFQDGESLVKKALFSQRLAFSEHSFVVVLILCEGLFKMIRNLAMREFENNVLYQQSLGLVSSFGFSDGTLTCLHISSPEYHPPGSV